MKHIVKRIRELEEKTLTYEYEVNKCMVNSEYGNCDYYILLAHEAKMLIAIYKLLLNREGEVLK